MVRKIQTSINLTPEIKNIVDTEGLNLSKFVGEQLEKYFSVSSIEEVNEKIAGHQSAILALEKKRADLLSKGTPEEQVEDKREKWLKFLTEAYRERAEQSMGDTFDRGWLDSRRFEGAVKAIGLPLNELLVELKERVK